MPQLWAAASRIEKCDKETRSWTGWPQQLGCEQALPICISNIRHSRNLSIKIAIAMSDSRVRQHRTKASYLTEGFQYRFIYSTFFKVDSGTFDNIFNHLLIDDTDICIRHDREVVVAGVVDEEEDYESVRSNTRS